MSYDLAVFASVNLANKMKSHLNKNGLYFGMLRAPHCIASGVAVLPFGLKKVK